MRIRRVVLLVSLLAIAPAITGCSNFDPDSLDVFGLNEKKKLPGERKDLFPGGVPGVTQGIPQEYLKGNTAEQTGAAINSASAAAPDDQKAAAAAAEAAKPKPKPRARVAARPPRVNLGAPSQGAPAQQQAWPDQQQQQQQSGSPWPAAQPQQQQQQQQQASDPWPAAAPAQSANTSSAPWPSAPAPGTFSKQ